MASTTKKKKMTAKAKGRATQKKSVAKKAASPAAQVTQESKAEEPPAEVEAVQNLATSEAAPAQTAVEEPGGPTASEEVRQNVEPQDGLSGAHTLVDVYMSIPSFRKRVISRLVKKLG